MKFINYLLGRTQTKVSDLKDEIIVAQKQDIQKLSKLNKKFRIMLEEGEIELVIRSVRTVIKEHKK
jgi:hypothetical protein